MCHRRGCSGECPEEALHPPNVADSGKCSLERATKMSAIVGVRTRPLQGWRVQEGSRPLLMGERGR